MKWSSMRPLLILHIIDLIQCPNTVNMGTNSLHGLPTPNIHLISPLGSGRLSHRPCDIFWRNRPSWCWRYTSKAREPSVPVWSPKRATGYPEEEAHWPSPSTTDLQRHRGWGGLDPRNRTFSSFHLPWLVQPEKVES